MKPSKKTLIIWLTLIFIHIFITVFDYFVTSKTIVVSFMIFVMPIYWLSNIGLPVLVRNSCDGAFLCFPPPNWFGWTVGAIIWLLVYFLIAVLIEKIFFKNEKQ